MKPKKRFAGRKKWKLGTVFSGVAGFAAAISAALMIAQLDISKKFSISQQRAYVFIEKATFDGIDTAFPSFRIQAKNFGQTPAYKLKYWARADAFPYPSHLPDRPFDKPSDSIIPPTVFIEQVITVEHPIGKIEWEYIRTGEMAVYLWGEMRYQNAFGQDCVMRFQQLVGGDAGLRGKIVVHDKAGNKEQCQ